MEDVPDAVWDFYRNLVRNYPPATPEEEAWMTVFEKVASRFDEKFAKHDSFELSFDALVRCHQKGKEKDPKYVRRACVHAHLNRLKRLKRYVPLSFDPQDRRENAQDMRLDVEAAIERMAAIDEKNRTRYAEVIELRLLNVKSQELAKRLEVSKRWAKRLLSEARRRLIIQLGGRGYDQRTMHRPGGTDASGAANSSPP